MKHSIDALIGVEEVTFQGHANRAVCVVRPQRILGSVMVAIGSLNACGAGFGVLAYDVDHSTLGPIAPEVGTSALHDLNPINAVKRDLRPNRSTAECVVDGNPVEQDRSPAGAARTFSPERPPSASGSSAGAVTMLLERRKVLNPRNLAKRIVQYRRWRLIDFLRGKDGSIAGRASRGVLCSGSRYHDRWKSVNWTQRLRRRR